MDRNKFNKTCSVIWAYGGEICFIEHNNSESETSLMFTQDDNTYPSINGKAIDLVEVSPTWDDEAVITVCRRNYDFDEEDYRAWEDIHLTDDEMEELCDYILEKY